MTVERASAVPDPAGVGAPRARPPRFTLTPTRLRLVIAFAVLLSAFLSALGIQLLYLRRFEGTLLEMKEHEAQMSMALMLEDAVRDRYQHEARWVQGDHGRLADAQRARARSLELLQALTSQVDEPDGVMWMTQIRDASAELDRLHEEVKAAVLRGDPFASTLHDRGYRQVSSIEENIDHVFSRLQDVTSSSRARLVGLQQDALRWMWVVLIGVSGFVVGMVLYLSRSVATPLARLSEAATRVADGDLSASIDLHRADEFGALADRFNHMTAALKQQRETLVASEKLAAVGRLAAGVAHEINNPLQVMLGYLSFNRDHPDRRLAAQLAAVEEETIRCKEIVEGLLALSNPDVRRVRVDLRVLCDGIVKRLADTITDHEVQLKIEGKAVALGDGPRLRQALFNIIKNAIEAAGPAGTVTVRVSELGRDVVVDVSDSGPGLPREVRERLFEPFFTTKDSGTGLGLAVSRAIAIAQGGDIEASNGEARGAVFKLRLPGAPEARA